MQTNYNMQVTKFNFDRFNPQNSLEQYLNNNVNQTFKKNRNKFQYPDVS